MMARSAAPATDELDLLIAAAERDVVETDRRVRRGAQALERAWRGRAGDAVRWSTLALGSGLAGVVIYRLLGARRRSAALRTAIAPPAARAAQRLDTPPTSGAAIVEHLLTPPRGPLAWLASVMLPLALRAGRTFLRRAARRPEPPRGIARAPAWRTR